MRPLTRLGATLRRQESDQNKPPPLESLELLGADAVALSRARSFSSGMLLTRGLVASPANYLTPTSMAACAAELAAEFEGLSLTVLEQAECEARGMGAYLGVSQGACEPPKFIHLTLAPPDGAPATKKVAFVGKGLTFDSGGYNIKAGAGSMIEKMKFDMGGAGAVLGAARTLAEVRPAGVEVHFIVAACENMVSAEAMRPGDILTASNKKTIEVLNTDAEGRLTLADALVYAAPRARTRSPSHTPSNTPSRTHAHVQKQCSRTLDALACTPAARGPRPTRPWLSFSGSVVGTRRRSATSTRSSTSRR